MVIVAHPDDADFGPAATAASWIDAGSTGWLVCCTSGDAGGEDPALDPLELAALREVEQARAAEGLTLGELLSLLGRRADALIDLWNAWGRVRPLLLEPL